MNRRQFIGQAAAAAAVSSTNLPAAAQGATADGALPLEETTVADLSAAMAQGRTTAVAIARGYLERIDALDRKGPKLGSIIELNPDALAIAETLDRERAAGHLRGPLHGIPVVVKDNIATADTMQTSAGSPALVGAKAPRDAFVVQRLREAGAVLLGKTNLSEWANIRGEHSISGWSTRGGQTRNPYALDRSPSGSSSGTGAAIAANLAALGVGTETDGSVTSPSSVNSLVGLKPTVGLLSRDGIVPISFSQDTAGPMCRTVQDAALLLAAMVGADEHDAATRAQAGHVDVLKLTRLDARSLRGARLGVAENMVGNHRGTQALFADALKALKDAGAVLVTAPIPNTDKYGDAELEILLTELKHAMANYLGEFAPNLPYRSLAELVAYNEANPQTLRYFGQELFEQAAKKGSLRSAAYTRAVAQARRFSRTYGIDAVMRKNRLDALIAPTCGPAWLIDPVHGDASVNSCTSPPAVAGYPHLTVPMGQVEGLPVGLSFIGTAWSEARLLNLGHAWEKVAAARKLPTYRDRSTG